MSTNRMKTALVFFVVTQMALASAFALTYPLLPERVATHFDAAGAPNGWMSRAAHLWTICGFWFGLSLFEIGAFYAIRFFPPTLLNLPRRDYWLAPERRDESFAFVLRSGVWLACLQSLFLLGLHLFVVAGNRTQPARLSSGFWLLMACFLAVVGGWTYALIRR